MDQSTQKVCCVCGSMLDRSRFYRRTKAADGLNPACKSCLAERRRRNRALSPEEKARKAVALAERPSKFCGRCATVRPRAAFASRSRSRDGLAPWCRDCNREYGQAYYAANKQKRDAQAAEWYAANRDRRRPQQRAWRQANLDRERENRRAWLAAHPGYITEYMRARRAALAGRTVGPVDLDALWTGFCGICDGPIDRSLRWPDADSPSIDHIHPVSKGGSHTQDNLQWTHLVCNIRKGCRLPD